MFALLLTTSSWACGRHGANEGHTHDSSFVPWQVDEFELFELTQPELSRKFEGKLKFDYGYTEAVITEASRSRLLLTFDNYRVATVQRVFVDGAGCHLTGPLLTSKKDALEFSIEGLSHQPKLSPADLQKLADAQKLLSELPTQHSPAQSPP